MKRLFKHPWLIIVLTLAVTAVLGFQLRNIEMDNSTRQYFPQKHESYKRLIETEDRFGSTVVIGVSLETDKGISCSLWEGNTLTCVFTSYLTPTCSHCLTC